MFFTSALSRRAGGLVELPSGSWSIFMIPITKSDWKFFVSQQKSNAYRVIIFLAESVFRFSSTLWFTWCSRWRLMTELPTSPMTVMITLVLRNTWYWRQWHKPEAPPQVYCITPIFKRSKRRIDTSGTTSKLYQSTSAFRQRKLGDLESTEAS